jgi:ABC-type transporter Mla subunit MlaD
MAQNVAALTQSTSTSISRMETGAELLGAASKDFAVAGERVAGVMEQAASVSTKLLETSSSLNSGASAIQELLRDYRAQRDAVVSLLAELRATVEFARKEATLTSDILNRIEGSANLLATAQKQADEYLNGVSRVLGDAHTSFATEVKRTLDKANVEFHAKLTSAVGLLSSAVGELELTLASMGTLKPVSR